MSDPLRDSISEFQRLAIAKAVRFGLQLESRDEAGVRASLGDLLFEFTLDHEELVVALASRSRPDLYYAAEYVAVMLGVIPRKEWIDFQRQLDEFVASDRDDVEPPAPLVDSDGVLSWACRDIERLHKEFCQDESSIATLDKIVKQFTRTQPALDQQPDQKIGIRGPSPLVTRRAISRFRLAGVHIRFAHELVVAPMRCRLGGRSRRVRTAPLPPALRRAPLRRWRCGSSCASRVRNGRRRFGHAPSSSGR